MLVKYDYLKVKKSIMSKAAEPEEDFSKAKAQKLREKLLSEIEEFKASRRSLQLATQSASGNLNASYAPFSLAGDGFYILVSDIARHGINLKETPEVSVMLIEDEVEAKNIFARKRLTFDAHTTMLNKNTQNFTKGIEAMAARFGEVIDRLSILKDFNLFKLTPYHGLYVKGIGQAFSLTGSELLNLDWKRDGHQSDTSQSKQK